MDRPMTDLVRMCLSTSIDVYKLRKKLDQTRSNFIYSESCDREEGPMERFLDNLELHSIKLSRLYVTPIRPLDGPFNDKNNFCGSGPLPLSSTLSPEWTSVHEMALIH